MADDETLEEWTARRRRELTGAGQPPAAVKIASALLILSGAITAALGMPGAFRPGDPLNERPAGISTIVAGVVRIALGFWLRAGSRRAYASVLLTTVVAAVVAGIAFNATGPGIQAAEGADLALGLAPAALLLVPSSLRWRRELTR
jgi:hypothetical protein